MSLGIAMKDLLFAVWKNSSRPKIGQFELVMNQDRRGLLINGIPLSPIFPEMTI